MISFDQFLSVIESAKLSNAAARGIYFDPQKFYLESIRSYFGISKREADLLLAKAQEEGVVEQTIGLADGAGKIVATYRNEEEIPSTIVIRKDTWEDSFEEEELEVDTALLERMYIFSAKSRFLGDSS